MPKVELALADIPVGRPHGLEHDGQPIVVVRHGDRVSAFVDRCPHAGWKLSDGDLNEGILECPGHSWEFNAQDGKCVTVPARCLTVLNADIQGEIVCIEWDDESGED